MVVILFAEAMLALTECDYVKVASDCWPKLKNQPTLSICMGGIIMCQATASIDICWLSCLVNCLYLLPTTGDTHQINPDRLHFTPCSSVSALIHNFLLQVSYQTDLLTIACRLGAFHLDTQINQRLRPSVCQHLLINV